jgi:hypothetical protein
VTVIDWLYHNARAAQILAWAIGGSLWTLVVIAATLIWKGRAWKYTFMNFLDDITRQEVEARDNRIAALESELEDEKSQGEALRVKVRSMGALNEKSIEIAGNTYRSNQ